MVGEGDDGTDAASVVLGVGDDITDAASVVVGSAAPVGAGAVGVSVDAGAGAIHLVHTVEIDVTVIVEMDSVV